MRPEKDPDGRLHVRAYDDASGAEPRPEGESAALVSDRAETSRILSGGAEETMVEEVVGGRTKPTRGVRLRAWLLLRAAIRYRSEGRIEPVVSVRSVIVLRYPDVARRVGLEPDSPELAAAERFLERRGYVRPVTMGKEPRAFHVTDAGRRWLEQDGWARPWWMRVFGS
jgi:hypothetical protein